MNKQLAFYRWFGNSKVVDDQGRPLVVYHGTSADFNTFDTGKGGSVWDDDASRVGIFFSADKYDAEYFGDVAAGKVGGKKLASSQHTFRSKTR